MNVRSECFSCVSTPGTRLTGPTREGRSVRQTSAEQQQMDGGCTPSNGLAFVAARSHSGAVTLTTPHGRARVRRPRRELSESRRPVRPNGVESGGNRPGGARSWPGPLDPSLLLAVPAAHVDGRTCQRTTLWHSDAPRRRTTCPRGPSRGTVLRRLRGSPRSLRLRRARSRRAVHTLCTA